jgi:hypothetical protein
MVPDNINKESRDNRIDDHFSELVRRTNSQCSPCLIEETSSSLFNEMSGSIKGYYYYCRGSASFGIKDVDDFIQDVVSKINFPKLIREFKPGERFSHYLGKAIYSVFADYLKEEKVRKQLIQELGKIVEVTDEITSNRDQPVPGATHLPVPDHP